MNEKGNGMNNEINLISKLLNNPPGAVLKGRRPQKLVRSRVWSLCQFWGLGLGLVSVSTPPNGY